MKIERIATISNDFKDKFGLPRQSGRIPRLLSTVVFEPAYRVEEALRGIEEYSHLWLIWGFSDNHDTTKEWYPTVRPPRLGGNKRVGVFSTRSPYRPNPLGLTLVTLERVEDTKDGKVLVVGGADMMDGTPIYDIKPYLPDYESVPHARGSFSAQCASYCLDVVIPEDLLERVPEDKRNVLIEVLKNDPRPAYQKDPTRTYGLSYAGLNVTFFVADNTLTVVAID